MRKKFSGAEKLEIVLHHHRIAGDEHFSTVRKLCDHYGISGEHLRQWRQQLMARAEEIYQDRRFFRARDAYEEEIQRLKHRIEQLEKELQVGLHPIPRTVIPGRFSSVGIQS